jgi:hypothetical protein
MKPLLLALSLAVVDPPPPGITLSGAAACPAIPPGIVVPRGIPPAAKFYQRQIIRHLHEAWGLGRAPVVFAQIHQESGFKCESVSNMGAHGLAQFMPGTAVLMQKHSEYARHLVQYCAEVKGCPFNPDWALRALALLDKEDYARYPRAIDDERYAFMLADYNGGNTALRAEINFCATQPGCDATKYFGAVRDVCGRGLQGTSAPGMAPRSTRTAENCKQNTDYARIILHDLRPRYRAWLVPGW